MAFPFKADFLDWANGCSNDQMLTTANKVYLGSVKYLMKTACGVTGS